MNKQTNWLYERAEGRTKHCWANDYVDFTPGKCGMVGQCHASLTNEIATQLLQNGIPYNAPGTDVAEHVYAVYRGIIYEAAPTQPGLSFHGGVATKGGQHYQNVSVMNCESAPNKAVT